MHAVINNEAASSNNKNKKQDVMHNSVVYCCLLSALPLMVGLTGAISASISAEYNVSTWNLKIGCILFAAGILAYFCDFDNRYASMMTIFGASWLGGAYAQRKHPLISFGNNQLPVYSAFLMTAMLGALFGLCCGAVNLVARGCFTKSIKTRSDLAILENIQSALQEPLDSSVVV